MRTTAAVLLILFWANASVGQRAKPKPKAAPKPDVIVRAAELQKDYGDNELTADRKYRLKKLEVTGKVKEIRRAPMSSGWHLVFETEGEIIVIASFFKENASLLEKVKRGEIATVIGTGAGMTREKKIYISQCSGLKKVEENKE